jgi:hypothetical protein
MPAGAEWEGWNRYLVAWRADSTPSGGTIYEYEFINPPGELLDAMEWASRNGLPMLFPQGYLIVQTIDVRSEEEYFTFIGGSRSSTLPGPAYPPTRTRRVQVRAIPTFPTF